MELFSWGANSYGQLGQGHCEDQLLPGLVTSIVSASDVQVSGGGGHSFLLRDGKLLVCGSNDKGQLGLGHREDVRSFQNKSDLSHHSIVKVLGGWDFSLALTDQGDLYGWGSNAFGQLGLGDDFKPVDKLTQILTSQKVQDFATGLRHSVILNDKGELFSSGSGRKGQLGIECPDKLPAKTYHFNKVPFPSDYGVIKSITAGAYHTAVLTERGHVIVWGDNKYGLSTQEDGSTFVKPYIIPQHKFDHKSVRSIHSGWTHMLAVTADGSVWSWGRHDYGQLGRVVDKIPFNYDPTPRKIEGLHDVQLLCGAEHNFAVTGAGGILSWGWNEHGMCANGSDKDVCIPTNIAFFSGKPVQQVGTGYGHSFAFAKSDS